MTEWRIKTKLSPLTLMQNFETADMSFKFDIVYSVFKTKQTNRIFAHVTILCKDSNTGYFYMTTFSMITRFLKNKQHIE